MNKCTNSDHYLNLILEGYCFSCKIEFGLPQSRMPSDREIDAMALYELHRQTNCYACVKGGEPCEDHQQRALSASEEHNVATS